MPKTIVLRRRHDIFGRFYRQGRFKTHVLRKIGVFLLCFSVFFRVFSCFVMVFACCLLGVVFSKTWTKTEPKTKNRKGIWAKHACLCFFFFFFFAWFCVVSNMDQNSAQTKNRKGIWAKHAWLCVFCLFFAWGDRSAKKRQNAGKPWFFTQKMTAKTGKGFENHPNKSPTQCAEGIAKYRKKRTNLRKKVKTCD